MATTIVGVRINSVSVNEDNDKEGNMKVTGNYSLISDKGKVMATQGFNGYSGVKVPIPTDVIRQLFKQVEKAVALTVGLEEDKG